MILLDFRVTIALKSNKQEEFIWHFDGIVTQKIVKELKNILGFKIDKIYEPDKNTVTLGFIWKKFKSFLVNMYIF